jgi:chromosome segregation ATPase
MNDDRIVQRLEEQLRDAHATNAELRERLADVDKREREANAIRAEGILYKRQLEQAHAKQKAAENIAATAARKRDQAERELLRAKSEIEELNARLGRLQVEADALNELNVRIEAAKHAGDLFSLSK